MATVSSARDSPKLVPMSDIMTQLFDRTESILYSCPTLLESGKNSYGLTFSGWISETRRG